MSKKKITMQMIADASGYSKYVVSKVLNSKTGVSEKAKQKVLSVAKQLGYFKDNQTKWGSLQKNSHYNVEDGFVLVVMPNHRYQNAQSHYWSKIFDGVIEYLDSLNIAVMVVSGKNNLSAHIKSHHLLGIITLGLVSTEMLLELNQHQVPIIMVDHEDSIINADNIFMDNLNGINKVTNHLVGLGHERMVFVGDNSYSISFYDRWLGFRTALEKNNLFLSMKENLLDINYRDDNLDQFDDYIRQLERKGPMPTAFVCANDDMAEKVMKSLQNNGYKIPDDCSVTGFDNLDYVSKLSPSLTTVQVLKESIGRRSVSMLLWRLENSDFPVEKIHITCEVIVRDSVSAPPSK